MQQITNILDGGGSSDNEECADASILSCIFNAFVKGVFALNTELSVSKGEPEGVMAALVETGKPSSRQLPKERADGASLAVYSSEAAPELPRTLGNILAILC